MLVEQYVGSDSSAPLELLEGGDLFRSVVKVRRVCKSVEVEV